MTSLPELAIRECLGELRAACRIPIDEPALDTMVGWLRPNFELILGDPDGGNRWADHGQRMRDNARHLGAFADFFGSHAGVPLVGLEQLTRAFQIVRADCTVRAQRTTIWEGTEAPGEPTAAPPHEQPLHAMAPGRPKA
jgi:hypothetical protein